MGKNDYSETRPEVLCPRSSDLVKRLRDPNFPPKPAGHMALRLRAADEIERLEEAWANAEGKISDLEAERERLQAHNSNLSDIVCGAKLTRKQLLDDMREWEGTSRPWPHNFIPRSWMQWLDAYEKDRMK